MVAGTFPSLMKSSLTGHVGARAESDPQRSLVIRGLPGYLVGPAALAVEFSAREAVRLA
jgi:hypothetical protein